MISAFQRFHILTSNRCLPGGWVRPFPGLSLAQLLALLLLTLQLSGCADQDAAAELYEHHGQTMGTSYSVKVFGAQPDWQALAIDAQLEALNATFSTYDPQSLLSQFNRNPSTDWINTDAQLVELVKRAHHISELSNGAYDVSVGPLVELWGFGSRGMRDTPPAEAEIASIRARIGYEKLTWRENPPALRKSVGSLEVDLSSIAKGYGVDVISARLDAAGIANYLVEIGGELRAKGVNAQQTPWRIAVEQPGSAHEPASQASLETSLATSLTTGRVPYRIIELSGRALATSGDYRNFFESGGQRFSHTLDPSSGRPVRHNLASVSVIADNCALADAWATALMALGPERAWQLAEQESLAAFFIQRTDNGFQHRSSRAFLALGKL